MIPLPVASALPSLPGTSEPKLGDIRFRALMSEQEWASLPSAIRRRFSRRAAGGDTIVYAGEVLETWMERRGWLLAQVARVIGGPLPHTRSVHTPSVVTVTEDVRAGGQVWTRLYARKNGFPQVIHSIKSFSGPTGLEEYLGHGFGIALVVYARDQALVFRSAGYFLRVLGRRFRFPEWMCPGTLYVTHAELPDNRFSFTLQLIHPRWGLLVRQMAMFHEVVP